MIARMANAERIARTPIRRATRARRPCPYWLARTRELAPVAALAAVVLLADLHLILWLGPWLVTR